MTSRTRHTQAFFRRAAMALGAISLSISASATGGELPFCEPPSSPPDKVLIGHLAPADAVPDHVTSVRTSFEVTEPDTGVEESYRLKIFSVATSDPPTEPLILATQTITVDSNHPLQPETIWIETPPVAMQWLTVSLEEPIELTTEQAAYLFAIEMTWEQLISASVRPYLEEVPEPANTYSSDDGGCTWTLLDDDELNRLRGIAGVDGSTYIRIRVQP